MHTNLSKRSESTSSFTRPKSMRRT